MDVAQLDLSAHRRPPSERSANAHPLFAEPAVRDLITSHASLLAGKAMIAAQRGEREEATRYAQRAEHVLARGGENALARAQILSAYLDLHDADGIARCVQHLEPVLSDPLLARPMTRVIELAGHDPVVAAALHAALGS